MEITKMTRVFAQSEDGESFIITNNQVVSFDDLVREGSMVAAREKGLVRQEGKEYIMQDGDIVLFKFNV